MTMLLLRIFGGDGWTDLGLRPNLKGDGFWWLASVLVIPVVITNSVLLGALLGGLELDKDDFDFVVIVYNTHWCIEAVST